MRIFNLMISDFDDAIEYLWKFCGFIGLLFACIVLIMCCINWDWDVPRILIQISYISFIVGIFFFLIDMINI